MAADNDEIMRAIGRLEGWMESVTTSQREIREEIKTLSERLTQLRLHRPAAFWGGISGGGIIGAAYLIRTLSTIF